MSAPLRVDLSSIVLTRAMVESIVVPTPHVKGVYPQESTFEQRRYREQLRRIASRRGMTELDIFNVEGPNNVGDCYAQLVCQIRNLEKHFCIVP